MKRPPFAMLHRLRLRVVFGRMAGRRGFALITVLGLVAMCLMLTVALLSVSDTSFKAENSGLDQAKARWTADNAVNTALGQLVKATTQRFPDGTPKPWTSQPGAIRVHGMDGKLETLHKLYTAEVMEVMSTAGIENDAPDMWKSSPDTYVDLNEPSMVDDHLKFPIVDPRAKSTNPLSSVEGFDYATVRGAVGPGGNPDDQRLPMPVRWVYQLRDGTLCTLSDNGRVQVTAGGGRVSKENPIVSRFAYWIDDESCKVNVNTAAEGAFWDTPVADTTQERALAQSQPTRLEYEREPGHPAGVCLSSVLLPGQRLYPDGFFLADSTMPSMGLDDARDLWRLGRLSVAELGKDTSVGGLQIPGWSNLWDKQPYARTRQPRYANVDELLFDTVDIYRYPELMAFDSKGKRRVHSFFQRHPEAAERLARSRFFLTADSAAPEVTLFGTPRIAMWPVHRDALLNGTTEDPNAPMKKDGCYDHKMAMFTKLAGRQYLIERAEPGGGANDFEALDNGANKRLYEYLKRLTDRPVPGFSRPAEGYTTLVDKYGEDRDAILIEMMDYVRATNFADGQLAGNMQFSVLCPGQEHKGFGQVSPLQSERVVGTKAGTAKHPQGLGRYMTVSEVALVFVCNAQVNEDKKIDGTYSDATQLTEPGDREITVGLMIEGFVPGQGWTDYRPYIGTALVGGGADAPPSRADALPKLMLNGTQLAFALKGNVMDSGESPPSRWQGAGGSVGLRSLNAGAIMFKPVVVKANADGSIPPLEFSGGSSDTVNQLKLAIYDAPDSITATDLLQVIPLVLPDIKRADGMPMPALPKDTTNYALDKRIKQAARTGDPLISASDVVQSLAPIHGDYRLTATQRWALSNKDPVFVPNPQWGKQRFAHTLRDAALAVDAAKTKGFIDGLTFSSPDRPDMPATLEDATPQISVWKSGAWTEYTLTGAIDSQRLDLGRRGPALPESTGDFDNGIGAAPDGAYSNRPDDGHWAAAKSGKVPYFDNVSQTGPTVPPVSDAVFSAQRLLPSPVMFGSLPTGSRAQVPWQTLLFRPQPDYNGHMGHYGTKSPPDHVLLDLFWSPVIEPEPISQSFETLGKVNLNHEMLPFRYIKRTTALHAAMKSEMITAIPDSASLTYKNGTAPDDRFRHYIDVNNTMKLWQKNVFDTGNVFLTAGQVCEQYLVPEGAVKPGTEPNNDAMREYWDDHRLTGDNTKERPYAHLYSRLTTRSNTYRVHFIAQSLKKARSSKADTFDSSKDTVTATLRGNALLRRELNTEDPTIPDYQSPISTADGQFKGLDQFYRWRCEMVKTGL